MVYVCKQQQKQLVQMKCGRRIAEILISLCCCILLILLFYVVVFVAYCLCCFVMKLCSAIMRILFAIISELYYFSHFQLFIYNFLLLLSLFLLLCKKFILYMRQCVVVVCRWLNGYSDMLWYETTAVQHVAVTSANLIESGAALREEEVIKGALTDNCCAQTDSLC